MLSFRQYLKESFLLENKAWHQFVGQHGAELLNRAGLTDRYSNFSSEPGHGTPKHVTDFLTQMLGLHDLTDDEGRWVLKHFQNGKIQRHEDIQATVIPNLMRLRDARSSGKSDASLSKIKGPDELHGHLSRVDPIGEGSFDELDPDEYTVHGENKHWTVVQPHTERAACTLGKGTNWCTASTGRHNMFGHYNQRGPLHIFIPKNPRYSGERYQSHKPEEYSLQMMDDRDKPVYDNPRMSGLRTRERPLPKEVQDTLSHVTIHDVLSNPDSKEKEVLEAMKHPNFAKDSSNVDVALRSKHEKVSLAALDHIREHDVLSLRYALHSPFESVAMKAFKHPNFDGSEGNVNHALRSPHESVALAAVKHPRFADNLYGPDMEDAVRSPFKSVATAATKHPQFGVRGVHITAALVSPHEEVALAGVNHPKFKKGEYNPEVALSKSKHESVGLEATKHPDFGKYGVLMSALMNPHESVQAKAISHENFGDYVGHITAGLNSKHESIALAAANHPNFRGKNILDALRSPHESVQLKATEHPEFGNDDHMYQIFKFSKHPSVAIKAIEHPSFGTHLDNAGWALTHSDPSVAFRALIHPYVREVPDAQEYARYSPHEEVRDAAKRMYGV
jgi:hypothetical protein